LCAPYRTDGTQWRACLLRDDLHEVIVLSVEHRRDAYRPL
jgi:hypothetical protein